MIAKAKELIPNKPIRYVVTSHHHWDHLGGIRAAMDEGATIVTHQSNKAFLERVAKTPHTIEPDRLATSKKAVKIQTVGDKGQLTDGTRTIELHRLTGYEHTGDMLVVYLPKEKILAEPDAFTPPAQAGDAADSAGRAVREGALRQHPAAEARRADDRAVPRQPDDRRGRAGPCRRRQRGGQLMKGGSSAMRFHALTIAFVSVLAAGPLAAQSATDESASVIAVVDRFHTAITTGNSAVAMQLLSEDAVMLEAGGVESRAQYVKDHLRLTSNSRRPSPPSGARIRVVVLGDTAWATSTGEMTGTFQGKPIALTGTELMVLQSRARWLAGSRHRMVLARPTTAAGVTATVSLLKIRAGVPGAPASRLIIESQARLEAATSRPARTYTSWAYSSPGPMVGMRPGEGLRVHSRWQEQEEVSLRVEHLAAEVRRSRPGAACLVRQGRTRTVGHRADT